MKHANNTDLDQLANILSALRALGALRERTRGVFYFRSRAFLHFHSDPAGLFADARVGDDFVRLAVNEQEQRERLLAAVQQALQQRLE